MVDFFWYVIIFIGVLLNVVPMIFGKNDKWGGVDYGNGYQVINQQEG